VVNPYGIIIATSIFLSLLFAQKLIKKKDEEILWGVSFWAILCGIIGARIYHILDYFELYSQNPIEIFKIWHGGLGIWGALAGGFLGAVVYLKIKNEKILPWIDVISVVVPLGQAVGRWGNFFNKEIFGFPTTLPWGMYLEPIKRPDEFLKYEKFHPLFIYESVLNLILFAVLYVSYKENRGKYPSGTFTALYLGGYSIIRFFLEYLRINPWKITVLQSLTLNMAQGISILVLLFSIVFILRKKIFK